MTQVWVLSFTPWGLSLLPQATQGRAWTARPPALLRGTPYGNSERGAQIFQSSLPSGRLGPPI